MIRKFKVVGRILCNNHANAAYSHTLHARNVILHKDRDKSYNKKILGKYDLYNPRHRTAISFLAWIILHTAFVVPYNNIYTYPADKRKS